MKRIAIAGLALVLSAGAASARPQNPPLDQAYSDDIHCAVVYMAVAAKGEDPNAAALGFYYFIGRLEGRRPDVNWRSHALTAAANSGASVLEHHAGRCGQALTDNGRSMGGVDDTIARWSRGEGQMGQHLETLRQGTTATK